LKREKKEEEKEKEQEEGKEEEEEVRRRGWRSRRRNRRRRRRRRRRTASCKPNSGVAHLELNSGLFLEPEMGPRKSMQFQPKWKACTANWSEKSERSHINLEATLMRSPESLQNWTRWVAVVANKKRFRGSRSGGQNQYSKLHLLALPKQYGI
jgi:hypothetical protein